MLNIFGLVTVSVSDSSRILQTNSLAGSFERKKPCVTFIIKTAGQHFCNPASFYVSTYMYNYMLC